MTPSAQTYLQLVNNEIARLMDLSNRLNTVLEEVPDAEVFDPTASKERTLCLSSETVVPDRVTLYKDRQHVRALLTKVLHGIEVQRNFGKSPYVTVARAQTIIPNGSFHVLTDALGQLRAALPESLWHKVTPEAILDFVKPFTIKESDL